MPRGSSSAALPNASCSTTPAPPSYGLVRRTRPSIRLSRSTQARRFFIDPARVRHPRDKARVENQVPFVRERWFAGESFSDDIALLRDAAEAWSREVAGGRVHGTTRRVPREVFEAEEGNFYCPRPPGGSTSRAGASLKSTPIITSKLPGALACTRCRLGKRQGPRLSSPATVTPPTGSPCSTTLCSARAPSIASRTTRTTSSSMASRTAHVSSRASTKTGLRLRLRSPSPSRCSAAASALAPDCARLPIGDVTPLPAVVEFPHLAPSS
jgi:hypothetical protein